MNLPAMLFPLPIGGILMGFLDREFAIELYGTEHDVLNCGDSMFRKWHQLPRRFKNREQAEEALAELMRLSGVPRTYIGRTRIVSVPRPK